MKVRYAQGVCITALIAGAIAACQFGLDVSNLTGGTVDAQSPQDAGTEDATVTQDAQPPPPPRPGVSITKLAAGTDHTCVVRINGTVLCWGSNAYSQLGVGADGGFAQSAPMQVSSLANAVEIAAGGKHTCAIRQNGGVSCWGLNSEGQLGADLTERELDTARTDVNIVDVVSIGLSEDSSCAVKKNGEVWCWGSSKNGQTGTSDVDAGSPVPTLVPGLPPIVRIFSGGFHHCAASAAGDLYCWGYSTFGATGRIGAVTTPVLVNGIKNVTSIALGRYHSCAVEDGTVKCWGYSTSGQIGAVKTSQAAPQRVAESILTGIEEVAAGNYHSCARSKSSVWCWGANDAWQLGNNVGGPTPQPKLVDLSAVAGSGAVVRLEAGGAHTCALHQDGNVSCWGSDVSGRLGVARKLTTSVPEKALLNGATDVGLGWGFGCASTDAGVLCWGQNTHGELAVDVTLLAGRGTPSAAPGPFVQTASAMVYHTCGLGGDAGVYCWGLNSQSQLGKTPVGAPFANDAGVAQVSASGFSTCARTAAGTVLCTGGNDYGELGHGTIGGSEPPAPVLLATGLPLRTVSLFRGGYNHACALAGIGPTLLCWGRNASSQLGTAAGSPVAYATPVTLPGVPADMALGTSHTCVLDTTGTVWCFGSNGSGQLGSTNIVGSMPTPVRAIEGATKLAAGNRFSCALLLDGTVRCWGENVFGQLGDGTTTTSPTPKAVLNLTGVVDIEAGADNACARKSDGSVWCWGNDDEGQLGRGARTQTAVPVYVRLP